MAASKVSFIGTASFRETNFISVKYISGIWYFKLFPWMPNQSILRIWWMVL